MIDRESKFKTPEGWITNYDRRQAKNQINFLFMVNDWLLISQKDLKVQEMKNIVLINLRLKWVKRPIWWMDCFDPILGMQPDLT